MAQAGSDASSVARIRLMYKKKQELLTEEETIKEVVEKEALSHALHASNLNNLLKKNWTEERAGYAIDT